MLSVEIHLLYTDKLSPATLAGATCERELMQSSYLSWLGL